MKLKDQMFTQFASSGLNELLKDFQKKYAPKKGMRFNKSNITYEIGAPRVTGSAIEYEISSKIPQDEVPDQEGKDAYFTNVKEIVLKGKETPISVEMDNIVWDAEKENEKKREYVKLVYSYSFDKLFDEKAILKEAEEIRLNPKKREIPNIPGIMTIMGKLVLLYLKENFFNTVKRDMESFIKANETVKKSVCK